MLKCKGNATLLSRNPYFKDLYLLLDALLHLLFLKNKFLHLTNVCVELLPS